MNILLITKRQYMAKDLLSDRYGRFYELAEYLAARGHEVYGLTTAYHQRTAPPDHDFRSDSGVQWTSVDLRPFPPAGLLRLRQTLKHLLERKPDILLGCSDAFHAILAHRLANAHNVPFVVDLYDQFESYRATDVPLVRSAFRKAVASADLVTCISARLKTWAANLRPQEARTEILGNAVNFNLTSPINKTECRQSLGLPSDAILIGTAGALSADRDIGTLYQAFSALHRDHDVYLVVAGPRDKDPPAHGRILDLGVLPHTKVGTLYGALDIGVVCGSNSDFAHYCHPQKLVEMQAFNLPIVIAESIDVGPNDNDMSFRTYKSGNVQSLITSLTHEVRLQKANPHIHRPCTTPITWQDQAIRLESMLLEAIRARA